MDRFIKINTQYLVAGASPHPWTRDSSKVRAVRITMIDGIDREAILSLLGDRYLIAFEKGKRNSHPHCHILTDTDIVSDVKSKFVFARGNKYFSEKKDFDSTRLEDMVKYMLKEADYEQKGFNSKWLEELQTCTFEKTENGLKDDLCKLRDRFIRRKDTSQDSVKDLAIDVMNIYKKYFIEFRVQDIERKVLSWCIFADEGKLENVAERISQNYFLF